MNTISKKNWVLQIPLVYVRRKKIPWKCNQLVINYHSATVDTIDVTTNELVNKQKGRINSVTEQFFRNYFDKNKTMNVNQMSENDLSKILMESMTKNREKDLENIILDCIHIRKFIPDEVLKKMFNHYSTSGKPEVVSTLQKYCSKVDPNLYKRNGEFMHVMAKAQCYKGNSDKGLYLLEKAYAKYEKLRSLYRLIFRELIHDSVLNRSEASLVVFKKHVLKFSNEWSDHYPIVCFWHICWSSTWFSDQMLSNELIEVSKPLRDIVKDKATAFSISILKSDYNFDAVMRLLEILLKYDMMDEYEKVLQVLFHYKLRGGDLRGCTEILKNCEALGIQLPADQQGRYIKMLINGKQRSTPGPQFKLKF